MRVHVIGVVLAGSVWAAPAAALAGQAPGPPPSPSGRAPLSLNGAIAEALARSPALAPSRESVEAADIRRDLAESAFDVRVLPSLQMGRDALGLDRRSLGVDVVKKFQTGAEVRVSADAARYAASDVVSKDAGYAVSLTQPMLAGFGPAATAGLKNARRGAVSSSRALQLARQDLVLQVARAYFNVVRLRRLVGAGDLARDRAAKLRAASEARMKVGLATQLDVLRADLLASQAESGQADNREALARSEDELALLLGRPLDATIEVDDADPAEVETLEFASLGVDDLVALALRTRLEVREARDHVGDAQRNESVARWDLLPRVDLTLDYARRGIGAPQAALLQTLGGGWRAGVSTTYSLDRASASAALGLAQVSVRGAERSEDDLERRIVSEVRGAWRARARAETTVAIQTKAIDLAQRQLRLAQLRYERGLADNFDVIDAESNLFQAQSALIAAEVDRAYAGLALERAVGTLDPGRFQP